MTLLDVWFELLQTPKCYTTLSKKYITKPFSMGFTIQTHVLYQAIIQQQITTVFNVLTALTMYSSKCQILGDFFVNILHYFFVLVPKDFQWLKNV